MRANRAVVAIGVSDFEVIVEHVKTRFEDGGVIGAGSSGNGADSGKSTSSRTRPAASASGRPAQPGPHGRQQPDQQHSTRGSQPHSPHPASVHRSPMSGERYAKSERPRQDQPREESASKSGVLPTSPLEDSATVRSLSSRIATRSMCVARPVAASTSTIAPPSRTSPSATSNGVGHG